MNSQLTAMNRILIGKPGRKKGLIIGGIARAMILVQAASVGSSAGVKTYIQTGVNPLTQQQLNNIDSEIEANETSQNDIKKNYRLHCKQSRKNRTGC